MVVGVVKRRVVGGGGWRTTRGVVWRGERFVAVGVWEVSNSRELSSWNHLACMHACMRSSTSSGMGAQQRDRQPEIPIWLGRLHACTALFDS